MRIFKLSTTGSLYEYIIEDKPIQEYIDHKKQLLGKNYDFIESVTLNDVNNGSIYRTYFTRSTMLLPIESVCEQKKLGNILGYEYYDDVYFDELFQIFNVIRVRIDMNWKFRYVIQDYSERMNSIIVNKVKTLMG